MQTEQRGREGGGRGREEGGGEREEGREKYRTTLLYPGATETKKHNTI
jgi:hypothetical protein